MFLILYATIGIPLMVMMLATFGDKLKHTLRWCIICFEQNILKTNQPQNIPRKLVVAIILVTIICLCSLSVASVVRQKWEFSTALYVWFVTITTIGFGDIIPEENVGENPIYDALRSLYITVAFFVGLALMSCIVQVMSDWLQSKKAPTKGDLRRSLDHATNKLKTFKEEASK